MKTKQIVLIVLVALLIVLALQNTEIVTIRFLFWDFSMSRVLLVLFTALLGAGAGYVLAGRRNMHRSADSITDRTNEDDS